jgi:succinate dehydrogenase/fumarate reductase cytochrome b subunit
VSELHLREKGGHVMINPKNFPLRDGCQCGGSCHSGKPQTLAPRDLLSLDFSKPKKEDGCGCGGHVCPRHYLAITGFILGSFLLLHFIVNAFGLWPARFQTVVNLIHGLGAALPNLEIGLVLALAVHVTLGLRALRREKLTWDVEKHHCGSDMRYWLQRVTAVVLLVFLSFHLATMHRWGLHLVYQITHWPVLRRYAASGLFEPQRAFASASEAQWRFWDEHTANPANWLIVQLYLLGLAAAVYHFANGVATGAEVMGLVTTAKRRESLWRVCIGAGFALAAIGMVGWCAFTPGAHH